MAHSVDSLGMYGDGRFFELLNGQYSRYRWLKS